MIISKTFLVVGDVIYRDGKQVRNIAEKKDATLNDYFKKNQGLKVLDIETNIQFGGQDQALVTLLYEGDEEVESKRKK